MEALPSSILFGPQATWLTKQSLSQLRCALVSEPCLSPIILAIEELPKLWKQLVAYSPSLSQAKCPCSVQLLQDWIHGHSLANLEGPLPNSLSATFTIIFHITQYCAFLRRTKDLSHEVIRGAVETISFQGFCLGLLSAIVLQCARTEDNIGSLGAIALRLAFCVGAFVDADHAHNETTTLAVRCTAPLEISEVKEIIKCHPEVHSSDNCPFLAITNPRQAYIAVQPDAISQTVVVKKPSAAILVDELQSHGFSVKPTLLNGRFHSPVHKDVLQVFEKLSESDEGLRFPSIPTCKSSLILNGRPYIPKEPLHQWVVRSILVDFCDWNRTLEKCLVQSSFPNNAVLCIGPSNPISTFTANQYRIRIMRPENTPFSGIRASSPQHKYTEQSVAVVGMACKFPGADSLDEYWNIIESGLSTCKELPPGRFDTRQSVRTTSTQHGFFGNYVNDIEAFDNAFFGKSRREAASMDPQQRLLLQVAYQALASSGYFNDTSALPKDVGCYIGCGLSDYNDNVASHPPTAYSATGTFRAFLSGNLSHYYGWTSPSMTFDTACSSSMVAIHSACTALKLNECSMAVAGGVNMITSPHVFQNLAAASFLSQDGSSRAFDASANGYCRGEGVGLLVLKKLERAVLDGDPILAVILGSGINQNLNSAPITTPHQGSQVSLLQNVVLRSAIDPHDVTYVEAHGTGTQKGDPAEAAAVRRVFGGTSRKHTLYLGSVKSNIGHTEGAAGVAGIIKAVLMMQHGVIPPQVNFSTLNPAIAPLQKDQMEITTSTHEWPSKHRVACINSYGASGSNAAAIICESPLTDPLPCYKFQQYPIYVSAFSPAAFAANCAALEKWLLKISKEHDLSNIAFNLTRKQNSALPYMSSTVVSSLEDLTNYLSKVKLTATQNSEAFKKPSISKPLILIFGGQESDRVFLSESLFRASAKLQNHLFSCERILRKLSLKSLFPSIFEKEPISDPVHHHVMLFCLQYAAAKTWIDSGLQPTAVIGHSFGQLTAMCVSGRLLLEDGLRLISGRATLLCQLVEKDQGCMIAVETNLETIHALISTVGLELPHERLEIACYNSATSFVLAGTRQAIGRLEQAIRAGDFTGAVPKFKRLQVPYAFHSRQIDPIISGYTQLCNSITFHEPAVQLEICTEGPHMNEFTTDLLIRHSREPVYFNQAIHRLADQFGPSIWLEAGSGSSIISMVRRSLGSDASSRHTLLPTKLDDSDSLASLSEATSSLWLQNHQLTFWPFQGRERSYTSLILPPYQFDKAQHWLMHLNPTAEAAQKPPLKELEFLHFESFEDREKSVARFSINPKHDRFQLLACGHSVLGTPLCPASLYVDLVTQAAAHLSDAGSQTFEFNPSLHDLRILAPLGATTASTISLVLYKDTLKAYNWSFTISSKLDSSPGQKAKVNATGRIEMAEAKSAANSTKFKLLSRVVKLPDWQNLKNSIDLQKVQGPIIYTIFNSIVDYSSIYRGLTDITTHGTEALASIKMPEHGQASIARILCDPLEIDNFLQVAGLHLNCLRGQYDNEILLATGIDCLQFNQQLGHDNPKRVWSVYAISSNTGPTDFVSDIFVFDPSSDQLYMLISGVHFKKIKTATLRKALSYANGTSAPTTQTLQAVQSIDVVDATQQSPSSVNFGELPTSIAHVRDDVTAIFSKTKADVGQNDYTSKLLTLLCDVGDIPKSSLDISKSFEEVGIDSLMTTEILSEIQKIFHITVSMTDFQDFRTIQHLCRYINDELSDSSSSQSPKSLPLSDETNTSYTTTPTGKELMIPTLVPTESIELEDVKLKPLYIKGVFQKRQDLFEKYASETSFSGFWTKVYPKQLQLVVSYIVEAFSSLGCDIAHLSPGETIPEIEVLGKNNMLMHRLFEILEEADIIQLKDFQKVRTKQPFTNRRSHNLHSELIQTFPQHANEHKLLQITGERLADSLTGKADALQLLFSKVETRDLLADVYTNSPLFKALTFQLGDFLLEALDGVSKQRPIQILEIGAGTGGTTGSIIQRLQERRIHFKYTFTDSSPSMIAKARKRFGLQDFMQYQILDIEKDTPHDLQGKFHVIISSNCIHATRSLTASMRNVHNMLRPDGFVALTELTRKLAWFDLVFGLLEGWWLFNDGRRYALAHELFWEQSLRLAGYRHVNWTEAKSQESQTMRVIIAFPPKLSKGPENFHATSICLQGSPAAGKKVFAFPGGFGTSATYSPMPKLSKDVTLYGLNSPFVKVPAEYDIPIDELSSYYVDEIRRVQPHGPYIIMGYSAGGVIAYEAARQLIQAGSEVEHLLLLDSACPLLVPPFPLPLLSFFESIDRFSGKERQVDTSVDKKMTDPHVVATLNSLRLYCPRAVADGSSIKTTLFVARSGVDKQKVVRRPVVSAEDDKVLNWVLDDRDVGSSSGWERLVGGAGLTVEPVQGNHFSLMKEPHINELAEKIVIALSL